MTKRKKKLTHLDARGRARMVDVSAKPVTKRRAVASAVVKMQRSTLRTIRSGRVPKGDVCAVARLAGIQAAKLASQVIPLCHPLALDHVNVEVAAAPPDGVRIVAEATTTGRTGVEMEAMVAAAAAALTVYDLCKAIDRGMEISSVRLEEKEGGRSGRWRRGKAAAARKRA